MIGISQGYTQGSGRWGDGEGVCKVQTDGVTLELQQGDRDCSSSVIECWKVAISTTKYKGKLDGATYTGNMKSVFTNSGLFTWHPSGDGYQAKRGDVYLNIKSHTAMCQGNGKLSEFSLNEFGGITGGQVGDQTGGESSIRNYYNFPWDGILAYNGKADSEEKKYNVGWNKDNTGWWYANSTNSYYKSCWQKFNGLWYYFNSEGYAVTGWNKIDGYWYYFRKEGDDGIECSMHEGWLKDTDGKWYYLRKQKEDNYPEGSMVYACTKQIDGKTYAFDASGAMILGSVKTDKDGALILK